MNDGIEDIMANLDGAGDEDMLKDIESQILNLIQHTGKIPDSLYHHWMAFIYAVDWTEPWLIGLLSFYVFLVVTIIAFQDNVAVQTVIYILLGAMVYLSERFNSYLSVHWNEFARQNYFDNKGAFTTTVFCFPLLLILVFQLVSTVY
jgi:transmembrane protein 18